MASNNILYLDEITYSKSDKAYFEHRLSLVLSWFYHRDCESIEASIDNVLKDNNNDYYINISFVDEGKKHTLKVVSPTDKPEFVSGKLFGDLHSKMIIEALNDIIYRLSEH